MKSYTILLELALILLFTKLLGIIFKKIGLPQVVGALMAGLILGPSILGWVKPSDTLRVLAEVGVILIMFSAGVMTNIKDIKENGLAALLVAAAGVLLPLGFGFIVGALFNGGFVGMNVEKVLKCVFIGIIMTATSVTITVETLKELGKLNSKAGTIILSAAIIDDIIGIILLSIIIGMKNPEISYLKAIGSTGLFFVIAIVVGIGIHFFFKWLIEISPHKRRVPIFALVVCLLFAYCGEQFFGVADITGAYLAGIMLSGLKSSEYVDKKIDISAYMLFAPVFFASIGINASFVGFNTSMVWFCVAFVAVAIITKMLGCFLASLSLKNGLKESLVIGVGMIARGEVCLIVMQKGISVGLIGANYLVVGVMLVIISSLMAPILLKIIFKRIDKHDLKQLLPTQN